MLKELESFVWAKQDLQVDLDRRLREEKFIDTVIAKGKSGDARTASVNQWLLGIASRSRIQAFFQTGGGRGDTLKEARQVALKYYWSKYGSDKGLTAKAANDGCHIRVDIIKGGKVIKSFGYDGGEICEIRENLVWHKDRRICMQLAGIAIRNIKRKKGKAAFLTVGLAVGVATVTAIVSISGAMRTEIAKRLDEYGANIIVAPETNDLSVSYGGFVVAGMSLEARELDEEALRLIRTVKDKSSLNILAPKLFGVVDPDGRRAVIAGVDFRAELHQKRWWEIEGRRPVNRNDLLLGSTAAERLGKKPGDIIVLDGRAMRVAGVLKETGGSEDRLIMASLPEVQEMLGKPGKLSLIEISAYCLSCPIDELAGQIRSILPGTKVTALKQAVKAREENLGRFNSFAYSVALIVLLVGALVVGVTMMGSVVERVKEIGVFRAVGFRRSHITAVFLTEAGLLGALGGLLGYWIGLGGAALFGEAAAQMQVRVAINPLLLAGSIFMAAALATLASLYPAWRAANLDPVEALRAL